MDREIREMAIKLRKVPPSAGAQWLIEHFPVGTERWGQALILLEHTSFPKNEVRKLAAYYLSKAPYASDRPYRVFAKLLGLQGLVGVLSKMLPQLQPERESCLLLYHLRPLLEAAVSEADQRAASAFVASLAAGQQLAR